MNLLISSSLNPYWNLATEEYLLKNYTEDFIFLYINQPCVVVGKHQNAQKEINSKYISNNNILVARRLSGGGSVYHDEGNLNFSFIQSVTTGENISYQSLTNSVYQFFKILNSDITLSNRNDYLLKGKKISGSAMHIYKNRVLAHNTLLVNCDLAHLSSSLKGNPERYTDKSIPSKRSEVMNLSDLNKNITIDYLIPCFVNFLKGTNNFSLYSLPESATQPIKELADNKYSTTEWIYGYSPKYTYQSLFTFDDKICSLKLEVEKGTIVGIILDSKDQINNNIKQYINTIKGKQHNIISINEWFNSQIPSTFNQLLFSALF